MRDLDNLGVFWLPGFDEDTLSGRLRFDPMQDDGITLSLVGQFDHVSDQTDEGANIRIVGWLGNERVTLDRCFSLSGKSFRSPGVPESRYYANQMLLGHQFEHDHLEFDTASIEISALSEWVGKTGLSEIDRMNSPLDTTPPFSMEFTPLEEEVFRFSRGQIALSYRWGRNGDPIRGLTFRQWPFIKITYDKLQTFEVIRKDVSRLQDLITLCVDEPVELDKIEVTRPDIRMRAISGKEMRHVQPIEYLAPPLRYTNPKARKPRYWHQMLLSYEELGGVSTLAKWIDESEKFQRPLDSLMSIRHARQMFAENRFLNVTFAAEAFHRATQGGVNMDPQLFETLFRVYQAHTPEEHHDWLRTKIGYGNELSLRKRLQQLATRSGEATRPLIGAKGDWAYTLTQVRNELTHLGGNSQEFAGDDLVYLTESVYAVVRICMLLESGAPMDALVKKANSYHLTWYRQRLKSTLEKVAAQLKRS